MAAHIRFPFGRTRTRVLGFLRVKCTAGVQKTMSANNIAKGALSQAWAIHGNG